MSLIRRIREAIDDRHGALSKGETAVFRDLTRGSVRDRRKVSGTYEYLIEPRGAGSNPEWIGDDELSWESRYYLDTEWKEYCRIAATGEEAIAVADRGDGPGTEYLLERVDGTRIGWVSIRDVFDGEPPSSWPRPWMSLRDAR
jgi:hypothetical protein